MISKNIEEINEPIHAIDGEIEKVPWRVNQ